jgi:SAM-dependent methyltransferase
MQKNNKILWEYSSIWGFNWIIGKYILPAIKRWGKKTNGIMVDVGCGTKPYAVFFKNISKYIGIDKPDKKTSADIYADALKLPLPDNSVDICFNSWLLDDINEPEKYFQEIKRILKNDGISIMIEAQIFPEHDAPNDYFRFTRYGLEFLATKNGFSIEEIIPLGGFWAQIGTQFIAFFMRGVSGKIGKWIRILNPFLNLIFFLLDKINFIKRGTMGYFVVFKKQIK